MDEVYLLTDNVTIIICLECANKSILVYSYAYNYMISPTISQGKNDFINNTYTN